MSARPVPADGHLPGRADDRGSAFDRRCFHADPTGRNNGWQLYLHYSTDYAKARDVRQISVAAGNRVRSDIYAGNIQYKLNALITLGFEQSQYKTFAIPNALGVYPTYGGTQSRSAHDNRSEFSTIFNLDRKSVV